MVDSTTANYNLNNEQTVELIPILQCKSKMNIIIFVKVEFMAELWCWTALDFTGVPTKVASECKLAKLVEVFEKKSHAHDDWKLFGKTMHSM